MENTMFFGGIPTNVDVAKIEAVLTPKPGDIIEYSKIEEITGIKKESNRWQSVTNAWRRKLMRERNIELDCYPFAPLNAFEAIDNSKRIAKSMRHHEHAVRKSYRATKLAIRTETKGLSEDEKRQREWSIKHGAAIRLQYLTSAKELTYPDPEKKKEG